MKFKVGDKVRVIKKIEDKDYGNLGANDNMLKFAGKEGIITAVDPDGNGSKDYHISVDNSRWYWNDAMLVPVHEIQPIVGTAFTFAQCISQIWAMTSESVNSPLTLQVLRSHERWDK